MHNSRTRGHRERESQDSKGKQTSMGHSLTGNTDGRKVRAEKECLLIWGTHSLRSTDGGICYHREI